MHCGRSQKGKKATREGGGEIAGRKEGRGGRKRGVGGGGGEILALHSEWAHVAAAIEELHCVGVVVAVVFWNKIIVSFVASYLPFIISAECN
jgi:hypothetical protein